MKKLLLITALFLAACESNQKVPDNLKERNITSQGAYDQISIITIDSCEYVKFVGYYKGSVCHKGNCKNPIHWKTITR